MNSKKRFNRAEIMAIEAPDYTKTWHPVKHGDVIDTMDMVLQAKGVGVISETYSIKNGGNNLFGTWVLDIEKDGKNIQLGFRNSISKNFAVGICAGTYVMVCSNMQFRGDYIEFRKHTSGLDHEELLSLGMRAFDQVLDQGNKAIEWHSSLNQFPLFGEQFKCATYDAMEMGILAPNHFNSFLDTYKAERDLTGDSSLFEFHGAITRMNRYLNLFTIDRRTRELSELCDRYKAIDIN